MSNMDSFRWEVISRCPLCDSESNRHVSFEQVEEEYGVLRYSLCQDCGLVFQSPRISEDSLAAFYSSGYRQLVQGSEKPTEKDLRVQAGRARHLIQFVQQIVPSVSHHLDIGSSSGALMRAFQEFYRCEGIGVEPGQAYRARSRSLGLDVCANLADLDLEKHESFDLVSMAHVLEHIPDPVAYLTQLRERWMTPGGYLLIEVPNLFGHRSVEFAHLVLFSPTTLPQVLSASEFEVLRLITHGNPRSPILRLYITVIAKPRSDGGQPSKVRFTSRGIRVQRAISMWVLNCLTEKLPGWTWKEWPELEASSCEGDGCSSG